jgi:hypothetical protein
MRKINAERNKLLFELWMQGHTIDEAALISDIPRSTVGYYFRKFKRYRKNGRALDFELGALKHLSELLKYVNFTNEETQAVIKTLEPKMKPSSKFKEVPKTGKTVVEIIDKIRQEWSSASMGSITKNKDRSH